MAKDPKDIIWQDIYELYYDTYFDEQLASKLIEKWKIIDLVLKIIIASAALLSIVSGFILWNNLAGIIYWFILSSIVLILSITLIFLNINQKIIQLTKVNKEFMALRYELDAFRNKMDINPDFDVKQYRAQLNVHEDTYEEICRHSPYDILVSNDLLRGTQKEINNKLSRIIQMKGKRIPARKVSVGGIERGARYPKPPPRSRQHKYNV